MNDAQMVRYIKEEVERQLQIILPGVSQNSQQTDKGLQEDIVNMYPGMDPITDRPTMHPFGFISRAAEGVAQVTARMGSYISNRIVLGHRDNDAPDIGPGESTVYNFKGYQIWLKSGSIVVGKNGVFEATVMGETLGGILVALVDAYNTHTHLGNLGAPTTPPETPFDSSDLDNKKYLAKDGGAF